MLRNQTLVPFANKLDEVIERLDCVERDTDKNQVTNRRDNVILYGIEEQNGESFVKCKEIVLDVLNCNVTKKQWKNRDIVRAHRIVNWSGSPRPMIVKFHHWDDKITALAARDDSRKVNIGIGNDITKRQGRTISKPQFLYTPVRKLHCSKGVNEQVCVPRIL